MATSRSKEKVSAALRKIFSTEKNKTTAQEAPSKKVTYVSSNGGGGSNASGVGANGAGPSTSSAAAAMNSPSKRLRCGVAPLPSGPAPIVCGGGGSSGGVGIVVADGKTNAAQNGKRTASSPVLMQPSVSASAMPFAAAASAASVSVRTRRLMKEFRDIQRLMRQSNPIFSVELHNDNLYEWHARLHTVDPESPLARDMLELGIPNIQLRLTFPENFPFAPPFMRVVEPRIEKGYVMEGGAICMELLTPRGWASAYTVEALLMQFSASVVKGRGRIMRQQKHGKEFNRQTAELAFRSLVKTHDRYGWVTPSLSDG